ncbi:zinc metalloprotease HtpX [Billgrantia gudaonensis]|uniref:Heat shock protein HtpX n=1 Tax=Billgrantia gudaonensis TaxID=376427 RepID=A0A1G9DDS3_9GAMM|nr:zinc metalloprotease HtpX [Halomonas gudaonensis]SDK61964.1 heat shock protein HtpX [Halomonas gudaonensis]
MPPTPQRLWRSRIKNGLQTLLIMTGLVLVLSIPGYLFAGPFGVVVCFTTVLLVAYFSSWVPARWILANSGAGLLHRHQAPALYRLLDTLYQRAGLQMHPRLYYAPSAELNAFAVGDQRDGGIAVTEGLLRTLSLRELAGVLAHETSHLCHGDTRVMSIAAAMTRLTVWATTVVQVSLLLMLPMIVTGELAFPWLTLLLVALAPTLSTLLQLALSRNREYTADLEAVAITRDPHGLASALQVLERHQGQWLATLFGQQPPAWIDWLRTHPPTAERIRRLLALTPPDRATSPLDGLNADGQPTLHQRPPPLGPRYWILRR